MSPFQNLLMYHTEMWRPDDGRNVGCSVSGGLSSAYQIAHIVESNGGKPDWLVCHFQNTGWEDWRTLLFVDQLDKYFSLGLVWTEFDMNAPNKIREVTFETADRNGRPFRELLYHEILRRDKTWGVRPLPNMAQRTCTAQLKIKTWHRYVRNTLNWPTQYYDIIGYRADEPSRYDRRVKRDAKLWEEGGRGLFPMHEAGVTTDDKETFWQRMPFTLQLSSDNGNCSYCFALSTWKLKERMLIEALYEGNGLDPERPPPRLIFWIEAEERLSDRPGVFRRDRPTYRQLWHEVCAGNLESSVPEGKADVCRTCSA